MDPTALDQVQLNFNPQGLFVINAAIGLMMLGVALELKLDDFKRVFRAPKAPAIELGAQFILFKLFSLIFFICIVAAALTVNWQNFVNYVGLVFIGVLIHNALALNLGYWSGRLFH